MHKPSTQLFSLISSNLQCFSLQTDAGQNPFFFLNWLLNLIGGSGLNPDLLTRDGDWSDPSFVCTYLNLNYYQKTCTEMTRLRLPRIRNIWTQLWPESYWDPLSGSTPGLKLKMRSMDWTHPKCFSVFSFGDLETHFTLLHIELKITMTRGWQVISTTWFNLNGFDSGFDGLRV